jgi:hypothetical protein
VATIEFVDGSERTFTTLRERVQRDPDLARNAREMPPGSDEIGQFVHHQGSDTTPELFEVRIPAGCRIPSHAHHSDEIIVVVEGSLRFGRHSYGPGSSVLVPEMTLYSFEAGPEGATFMNFRPRRSPGAMLKDEYMAKRGEQKD